ncbi:Periplasmic protease [Pedobacter cryoconitis]|uniref:Periplasmic protease n=1 Tax=Pedobacter cryoconitis TaxID=188932 RepID=A0A127V7L8_9SPHI|nr:S41 family peptidase [Pedobacter cryoconitis]AMP97382.1 Periplasmic protease [Pedobacter cryoconitis]
MINFNFTICVLLMALGASAQQNPENQFKNTSWVQQGYGRCLKIEDSTYTYYNTNNMNCKALAEGKMSGRFTIVSLDKNELILNPGGIVNYIFKRVDSLPPMCTHPDSAAASYEENFKVFWETFNDNYAFFRERNINWKQVYEDYLPRVKKISSEKELADILREIVKKIGDGHIRLEVPDELKTKVAVAAPVIRRKKDDIVKAIQERYLVDKHTYNNGVINWGKLKSTKIGYLMIKDMNNFSAYVSPADKYQPDFAKKYDQVKDSRLPLMQFEDEINGVDQIMKKILADIGQSDSIVIDLRFNGGGLETVALRLLSYFVGESKHVLSVEARTDQGNTAKQKYILQPANSAYKGKVCILLSGQTASAAEIFALAAQHYPNIRTMGTRTAGIFSEILWKELPNGWEFSLSNEIYTDSNGKTYEGTGVPVINELNYSRNRLDFYNSFYSGDGFTDKAMDQIRQVD